MASLRTRAIAVAVLLVLAALPASSSQTTATLSKEAIREFLATAKIVKAKNLSKGVTRPVRVTLSDGVLTHDAVFSSVEERRAVERFASGKVELDFVDSFRYSLAAYRLAELLGLDDMMPVHVEREWDGRRGALAWWVDAQMDEGERLKRKVPPPQPAAWNQQMYRMRVFSQFVADTDRNVGNILIDRDWKVWMIDFTRAFRRTRDLPAPGDLTKCDRALLERLRGLTREAVMAATKPYIGGAEVDALLARRDAIVARFEQLVTERGAAQVLF